MERTNRAVTSRKSRTNARNSRGMYVDGSAVRKLQEMPSRTYSPGADAARKGKARRDAERRSRELSQEVIKNREKVQSMGRSFVVFIGVISVMVLLFCVYYLRLQSDKTAAMKNVAALESDWSSLKEENDAYESQVNSSVDLNSIKQKAIGSLGMDYPTEDQTKTYSVPDNSYVRQYKDVE